MSEVVKRGELYVFPSEDFSESLNEAQRSLQEDDIKAAVLVWLSEDSEDIYLNWYGKPLDVLGLLDRVRHRVNRGMDEAHEED